MTVRVCTAIRDKARHSPRKKNPIPHSRQILGVKPGVANAGPKAQPGLFQRSVCPFKIRLSAPKLQNLMRNERASMRSADILGGVPFSVGTAPPLVNAWQLAGWYDPRFPRLVSPSCQKVARSWQCNGYLADAESGQPILLRSLQLLTAYRFEP